MAINSKIEKKNGLGKISLRADATVNLQLVVDLQASVECVGGAWLFISLVSGGGDITPNLILWGRPSIYNYRVVFSDGLYWVISMMGCLFFHLFNPNISHASHVPGTVRQRRIVCAICPSHSSGQCISINRSCCKQNGSFRVKVAFANICFQCKNTFPWTQKLNGALCMCMSTCVRK